MTQQISTRTQQSLTNSVGSDFEAKELLSSMNGVGGGLYTVADAATVTFDLNDGNRQRVTLGGNRTLAVANAQAGQFFAILLYQDGTGGRTVTWFSGIRWSGGSPPTLTTVAGQIDMFTFLQIAPGSYLGAVAAPNC